jgi:hypothetical protein
MALKILKLFSIGLLFVCVQMAGYAKAASIVINPDTVETIVAQPFAVDIFVYNLEAGQTLDNFEFNIGFDNQILGLIEYQLNDNAYTVSNDGTYLSAATGRSALNLNVDISQKTSSSSYTLATLTFTGLSSLADFTSIDFDDLDGDGNLTLDDVKLISGGVNIFSGNLNENIIVSVVPVPAAFWLLATGLLGGIGLRNRRKVIN